MSNQNIYSQIKKHDKDIFLSNVVFLRDQHGLTQSQMVNRIGHGVKLKTYQSWEERRAFPPLTFCCIIAGVFEKDLKQLLGEKLINTSA
jgi:DNA-binding XRE family transcriptional regulator